MKKTLLILLLAAAALTAVAREYADSAVWQGMNLKLDLGMPVLTLAQSGGRVMNYEAALNVRLLNRLYPTIELGYGQADCSAAGGAFFGRGGYGRVGLDLSALKKSSKDYLLLVGLRLGTAVQGCDLQTVRVTDPYWQRYTVRDYPHFVRADVWGEIVLGVQVKVYKSFHMGWYARMRFLFTRKEDGKPTAWYIPGYGYRQDSAFGINYYVGWNF